MKITREIIRTDLKFSEEEAMRLIICLFATQNNSIDDKDFVKNFQLYQGAVLYLSSKLGAELEDTEKEVVDLFATKVLKINQEN